MEPTKMSVREWAKRHDVSPQLVHYYLRTSEAFREAETRCDCGNRVLIIDMANKLWAEIRGEK